VEDFLAFLQDNALLQVFRCESEVKGGNFFPVGSDAALLDETSDLALAGCEAAQQHQIDDRDAFFGEFNLCGGHVIGVSGSGEQTSGGSLRLVRLLFAVNEFGQLVCEDLFLLVDPAVIPLFHLLDLFDGEEGEHADALHDVRVIHVSPVLIELKGSGLVRVKPDRVACGLSHLVSLGVGEKGDGEGMGVLAQFLADEFGAGKHVAPLVIPAELHIAVMGLEEMIEVVGLHDHVVELEEAEASFHAVLVAFCAEHVVHRETGADFAEKLDVVEVEQPVRVVDHLSLALAEFDEAFHLFAEALGVVVNVLDGEHLAHVCPAGRVSDQGRAAADERDGTVACGLKALHESERHKVTGGQAVRRAVKADVEGRFSVVDHLTDQLLVGDLGDQAAGF